MAVRGRNCAWARPANGGRRHAPSVSELLELIRAELVASPFQGEGHRKVWARSRVRDHVKVGRRRVLRLMRENHLLSPYRGRRGAIPTSTKGKRSPRLPTSCGAPTAPRASLVEDGWVWLFVAVEHWECRVHGVARLQTWNPVCGPGAHFSRFDDYRRLGGQGMPGGVWPCAWTTAPISIGSFPEPGETLGDQT